MGREIVTVGGGTGSPKLHEALLLTGKVDHINAIAATTDDGGATGKRRKLYNEIAYSDAMRILFSLVHPDEKQTDLYQTLSKHFNHRDERNTVLGQDIFNRFFDPKSGFSELQRDLTVFGLNLRGTVLPATVEPTNIVFETSKKRRHVGEHLLDDLSTTDEVVEKMYLAPSAPVFEPAADALINAPIIMPAFGSLNGSTLAPFLATGMKEAVKRSSADLYHPTNLISTRNETHQFMPEDFVNVLERYTGKRPTGLIVPEMTRREFESKHPDAAKLYDEEQNAHFLGWEPEELYRVESEGVKIITHKATSVVRRYMQNPVVRHDAKALAHSLKEILPN